MLFGYDKNIVLLHRIEINNAFGICMGFGELTVISNGNSKNNYMPTGRDNFFGK